MKYGIFIIYTFAALSCSKGINQKGEVTASFTKEFKHYARFEEIVGDTENIVKFELYSIPDSLAYLYANRDSLVSSAIDGNLESLRILRENNLDEGLKINKEKFTQIGKYTLIVPSAFYNDGFEKMIWSENGDNSIYLPNLDIVFYY